jgi:hypothetical protein
MLSKYAIHSNDGTRELEKKKAKPVCLPMYLYYICQRLVASCVLNIFSLTIEEESGKFNSETNREL